MHYSNGANKFNLATFLKLLGEFLILGVLKGYDCKLGTASTMVSPQGRGHLRRDPIQG